jgi:hypothetical protein
MTFNSPSVESFDNTVTQMPLWRRLAMITSLAIGLFYTARIATRPVPLDAASAESVSEPRTCRIEEITLGMRVVGRNPLRHETSLPSKITLESWRAIHLTMNQNGTEYKLAFLRSLAWLKSASAVQGATIQFRLPEMGLGGPATVDAIMPCPTIEPDDGTGRMVVTGTMRHLAANIIELHVSGLDQPIGVTDTHPIWSEARKDFVPAGQLRVGEELRTANTKLASKVSERQWSPRGREMVFNLEVDSEHVYFVSAARILVHNAGCFDHDILGDPRYTSTYDPGATHIDHTVARALGGPDDEANERAIEAAMNLRKGGLEGELAQYRDYLFNGGMSMEDATSVIMPEIESLGRDVIASPMSYLLDAARAAELTAP